MGSNPALSQEFKIPGTVGPMEPLPPPPPPAEGEGEQPVAVFTLHEWGRARALVWGAALPLAGVTLPPTVALPSG